MSNNSNQSNMVHVYNGYTNKMEWMKIETDEERTARINEMIETARDINSGKNVKGYKSKGFIVDATLGVLATEFVFIGVPVCWFLLKWILTGWWGFSDKELENVYFAPYLWSCMGIVFWVFMEFLLNNKWLTTGIWLFSFIFFGRFLIFH